MAWKIIKYIYICLRIKKGALLCVYTCSTHLGQSTVTTKITTTDIFTTNIFNQRVQQHTVSNTMGKRRKHDYK